MVKHILLQDSVRWRWMWRLKLVIGLLFVCVATTQCWTPTAKMEPALLSCHEKCFACKSAHGEWRAGDITRNENCKLCNDCYKTILNYRRNIDAPQSTAEGHYDKFIMISNEESVYPVGCPRPPACPEDYPWEVLKTCPTLQPCDRPRRALDTHEPSEDQTQTTESNFVDLVKPYSPVSRPTIAWPTTADTTTSTSTTTTTTNTPPTNTDAMKLLRIQRKATLNSKIFPDGNIFLLKQVAKNAPSPRPTIGKMQVSYPNRPLLSEILPKHKVAGVRVGKRIEREGETTMCLNETVDQNFFDDNEDETPPDGEKEHAFRPHEYHEKMKTMEYHPHNAFNEEDSADKTETKLGRKPQPKANDIVTTMPVPATKTMSLTATQATKTQPATFARQTPGAEPLETLDSLTSHPQYGDYVTFPPYSDNTLPIAPNCCPSCICSMPMCMMGGCAYGAPQNNVYRPAPTYPEYLELDDAFAKSAAKHKANPITESTTVPGRRGNKGNQIVYFGFLNS